MRIVRQMVRKLYAKDIVLEKFIKGSFWAVFGNIAVKGFSLLASLIIARFLGSATFGELSVIKTTLSVFSLFSTFGLGVTVTKFISESRKTGFDSLGKIISASFTITMITGGLLGTVMVIFASFISIDILHSENLITPLRISGVYLFFNAINVCQVGVLAGLQAFKPLARINLIMGLITLPVLVVTTYFFSLNGALLGLTINLIINWYLHRLLIQRTINELRVRLEYVGLKSSLKLLVKFSYPLALKEIIYSFSNWAWLYLLLIKTNYNEVGVFTSANQLSQLMLFLPASISSVFLSLLANELDDKEAYSRLVKRNISFTLLVTILAGSVVALLSGPIYRFYGGSYSGGEEILYILILATIPMSLSGILNQICISSSKPGLVTKFQIMIQSLILVSCLIFFSINEDATSLAYAFLGGYSISTGMMYFYLKHLKIF